MVELTGGFVTDIGSGPIQINGRFNQIKVGLTDPHEISRSAYRTATKASELKIEDGAIIGSYATDSGDEHALWEIGNGAEKSWIKALWSSTYLYLNVLTGGDNGAERASALIDKVLEGVPWLESPPDGTVSMDFWYWGGDGPKSRNRRLEVPKWNAIEGNYSAKARDSLSSLMDLTPEDISTGRIMLMHGPPGTGKTTAIRALGDAWKPWCELSYVVDAEMMFSIGGYLMQILLESPHSSNKWRLVIIEDAEEFITPDAKKSVGQALARLLNLGDGMLGQGLNILVLMTTNVPVAKLHEAIMRPGRCLANIEVPRLSPIEATQWSEGAVRTEATLAELFETQRHSQIGTGMSDKPRAGVYL